MQLGLQLGAEPKQLPMLVIANALDSYHYDGDVKNLKVNNIKGEVREARASIKWKPWTHAGFDLAYNYFEVRGKGTK